MKNDFKSLTLKTGALNRLLAEGRRITHLNAISASTALEAVLGELDRLRAERLSKSIERNMSARKAATK